VGRARSARVIGAASVQNTGTSITSVMCMTMCAENSRMPYTNGPPLVTQVNTAQPTSHETVRPTGQRSPRAVTRRTHPR